MPLPLSGKYVLQIDVDQSVPGELSRVCLLTEMVAPWGSEWFKLD